MRLLANRLPMPRHCGAAVMFLISVAVGGCTDPVEPDPEPEPEPVIPSSRATFGFGTPIPDTVFGRSLTVHARVSTAGSAWQLARVMDTGAVGAHVVTGAIQETGLIRRSTDGTGWMNVAFDYPLVLRNGRHRASLRLTDEHGVRTIGQDFVIHVPAATYSMRVLPGLSIGQAVARDVSSVETWSAHLSTRQATPGQSYGSETRCRESSAHLSAIRRRTDLRSTMRGIWRLDERWLMSEARAVARWGAEAPPPA